MHVKLPPVWGINSRSPIGVIRRLEVPSATVELQARAAYTRDRDRGQLLTLSAYPAQLRLFSSDPRGDYAPDEYVLVVRGAIDWSSDLVDLSKGSWWRHPNKPGASPAADVLSRQALASWAGTFRFAAEDAATGVVGLRNPQLGALHAIHAHWSTSSDTATIVMPTGTGKTETMLATLVSARCLRVLVIVPTDALRIQLAEKFESLGMLKHPTGQVLGADAERPVVGMLTSKPNTVPEADAFFLACNVIVTTSQLIGGCRDEIQDAVANTCSHLFIDEAHHSEAAIWRSFRERFREKRVVQFTATPFREDDQKIDGKLIFVYPLRQAQAEGYFRPIRFHAVLEFDPNEGDREIADAAIAALDADETGKHIVMARVSDIARATAIHQVYEGFGRYHPVVIHSRLSPRAREEAKRMLFSGEARVVVCVDMLGEGFDLPELKIAAFHDIKKSLAVTLQLAGRFTRAREDLGDPVFIANTALLDVRDELRKLYSQDPDWNALLPELSTSAIDAEVTSQEFFAGFDRTLSEVPLQELRPAASMVVYRTHCANWTPRNHSAAFRGLRGQDRLYWSLNDVENTLVIVLGSEEVVKWSESESVTDWRWELFIAVWDRQQALLYIHGAGNSGDYKTLAKALCGDTVEIMVEPDVYRCFHGVRRLVLNNVGLDEHLGRQVRFVGRMGADVEGRIPRAIRQTATKAVLAGSGYERGERASVGAAKRGRIWSHQRLRVDTFPRWARRIGSKLIDESIDPHAVLEGTLKPQTVGEVPRKTAVGVEWPSQVYERPESGTLIVQGATVEHPLTFADIELVSRNEDEQPLLIRVFGETWESTVRLRIFASNDSFDFEFLHEAGVRIEVRQGTMTAPLHEFFTQFAPIVWFADGSSLEGTRYVELPLSNESPFPRDRLTAIDWTGIDIRRESQGENRAIDSIQFHLIQRLQADPTYTIIFDDDGAGEAADVVAVRQHERDDGARSIEVEFYHCKYANANRPGARVDDLYVVCGQAQRSVSWLISHDRRTELFVHLLKREAKRRVAGRATRYERGNDQTLARIRELSRQSEVKLKIFVVQPGMSQGAASDAQLQLLAVTERYLTETYEVPLGVMCSP